MSSAPPPIVFHKPKHLAPGGPHAHKPAAPLIPVIPDLRFESSYVRSVRRYVEIERVEAAPAENRPTDAELLRHALIADGFEDVDAATEGEGEGKAVERGGSEEGEATVAAVRAGPSEIIRVQWKSVIWVTVRDQVIGPLVQGTLWALASYYITPFSTQLGSRMGTFVHQSLPSKEGQGVTWLRNWAKNIGFSSSSNTNGQPSGMYNSSSSRH